MKLKELPDDVQHLAQTEYNALRTRANTFMNRNWWWVMLATFGVGWALGRLAGWLKWPF